MIMPRSSGQLLLPVNPLFVGFTLLVGYQSPKPSPMFLPLSAIA